MDIRYDEINYSEMMTFIDTVRFGTISRAAEELNISQPAASKRIASLEEKYGIRLFNRKGKGLELTSAGKVFYDEMVEALKHIVAAFSRASDMQANPVHILRIGYDGFFDVPLLYDMIDRLRNEHPDVRAEVINYSMEMENCADLFNGNADILIAPDAWFASVRNAVSHQPVAAFQFSILVPETNPMFDRTSVDISDLRDIPLTIAHTNSDSPYLKAIDGIFREHGIRPRIDHLMRRENLCLDILMNGNIAIATGAFFRQKNEREEQFYARKIHVYPIENAYYPVSFVWRRDNPDRYIKKFVKIFQETAGENSNGTILERCYGA